MVPISFFFSLFAKSKKATPIIARIGEKDVGLNN